MLNNSSRKSNNGMIITMRKNYGLKQWTLLFTPEVLPDNSKNNRSKMAFVSSYKSFKKLFKCCSKRQFTCSFRSDFHLLKIQTTWETINYCFSKLSITIDCCSLKKETHVKAIGVHSNEHHVTT